MIPKFHIVHYNNFTIYYLNGVYTIREIPGKTFFTINEAFKEIDKYEPKTF